MLFTVAAQQKQVFRKDQEGTLWLNSEVILCTERAVKKKVSVRGADKQADEGGKTGLGAT